MLVINDVEWEINVDAHFIGIIAQIEQNLQTSGVTLAGTEVIDFSGTSLLYDIPLDCSRLTNSERARLYRELSEPKVQKIRLPNLIDKKDLEMLITEVRGGVLLSAQENSVEYVNIEGITARILGYWRVPR